MFDAGKRRDNVPAPVRTKNLFERLKEERIRRKVHALMHPAPTAYEWIEEKGDGVKILEPIVSVLKSRRRERIAAAVTISFGSSLSPEERAPFLAEEEMFMAGLTKREQAHLGRLFPPCPGCH